MIEVGFIGAGNMGGALATAAAKCRDTKVLITDTDLEKASALAKRLKAKSTTAEEICKTAKYIFLGVKPQILPDVLGEIAPLLKERRDHYILVSMAAGVKCEKIANQLNGSVRIIRIMPNMPVAVGSGMVLYTATKNVTKKEKKEFVQLMQNAGVFDEIGEELIDAASAVSGCGPAFVFMFMDALADGGVQCGLSREQALKYAAETVLGSAKMLLQTNKHPIELKDAVCSPKGSTIEGVYALENADFKVTVMKAVDKSFKRTKELGK